MPVKRLWPQFDHIKFDHNLITFFMLIPHRPSFVVPDCSEMKLERRVHAFVPERTEEPSREWLGEQPRFSITALSANGIGFVYPFPLPANAEPPTVAGGVVC